MSKVDLLRKIIREELRRVLKEEGVITEGKRVNQYEETFKSKATKQESIPLTLNTHTQKIIPPKIVGNNMLNTILSETAMGMQQSDEMYFSSHDVDGFAAMQRSSQEVDRVGSVNTMIASSNPSGVHEMVQINEVPDFSKLMDKMMQKGTI